MKLSYKIKSEQGNRVSYSIHHGSYVKLSTFTQHDSEFRLDFDINLYGLSQLEVLKYIEEFATQHNKTRELEQALQNKKEKGGLKFIWGFLSLVTGGSYILGYQRLQHFVNQSSPSLQTLFYQGLISKSPSTITISGKGTTKSSQKSYLNIQLLQIKSGDNRSLTIVSTPRSDNLEDYQLLDSLDQAEGVQQGQRHEGHRHCRLPPMYSLKNNFNLKPVEKPKHIADRFPTNQQAQSLLNYYYDQVKTITSQTKSEGPEPSRATLALPTEEQFLEHVQYHPKLWKNGSTIRYCFLKPGKRRYITSYQKQIPAVVQAFNIWRNTGLNLNFVRTQNPKEAQIRISFFNEGSYSLVGTDCLEALPGEQTMNFGWTNIGKDGTAIHEIGHALGLYHQHQNPYCLIQWNRQNVIDSLKRNGNDWTQQQINSNIFEKIPVGAAYSSRWDPTSIMHYNFNGSDIISPQYYRKNGIPRNSKLSSLDIEYIRKAYPRQNKSKASQEEAKKQIHNTFHNICHLLGENDKKFGGYSQEKNPQRKQKQKREKFCSLPPIYNLQNSFNLQIIQSPDIAERFPSNQQASSLLNHYYGQIKNISSQKNSQGPQPSHIAIAVPTEQSFLTDSKYKPKLWKSGSTITYCFLQPQPRQYIPFYEREIQSVINAFDVWKGTGLNLNFVRIYDPQRANIRIGFRNNGSWSYIGTDCLNIAKDKQTMNFGWANIGKDGTAIHQIGHALGLYHQHQNPYCLIQWNRQNVIDSLKRNGNNWSDQQIQSNIFDKIPVGAAYSSRWDPTSIMHYNFNGSDIISPQYYHRNGIPRNTQLSKLDIEYIRKAYPWQTRSNAVKEEAKRQINETYHNICHLLGEKDKKDEKQPQPVICKR